MKKAKKIIVMSLATTMLLGSTLTAHAATPQYKPLSEYGYTGVPKITVKLPDSYQTGISNAVEDAVKDLDIKLLNTPTITRATITVPVILTGPWNGTVVIPKQTPSLILI